MRRIKMLTDSASDIPVELEKEYDITIMPFPIVVGDNSYMEREDFTVNEFYKILEDAPKIPTTAQITQFRFFEEFEKIEKDGYQEVIYVSINSKGSNTYNNALMAKEEFFETYPNSEFVINIIDSKTYTAAYGYPIIESAKKAKKGVSSSEIIAYLKDWFDSVEIYFAPYTLEFVKKSGRVPVAAAFVGELMGLRPIISIIDGETKIVEKVRGDKAIIPALLKQVNTNMIPKTPYLVLKTTLESEAIEFSNMTKKSLGYDNEGSFPAGACIVINAGYKLLGVVVKGKKRIN